MVLSIAPVLLLTALSADPPRVTSTVCTSEIALDDVVTWTVMVHQAGGTKPTQVPAREDWEVVQSSTHINLVGQGPTAFDAAYSLDLKPRHTGNLSLPALSVQLDGRAYTTQPLSVKVLPAGAKPRHTDPDPDPFGLREPLADLETHKNAPPLVARLEVETTQALVGQVVRATPQLYTRVDVFSEDTGPLRGEGYESEPMPGEMGMLEGEVKEVEGVLYRPLKLPSLAVRATRPGRITLAPITITVEVSGGRKLTATTKPVELQVKPLPAPVPAGFERAPVGSWVMVLRQEADAPATTPVGQPLEIELAAQGPTYLPSLPELEPVPGLRFLNPVIRKDRPWDEEHRPQGYLTSASYLIIPERPGHYSVPAAMLRYYDPTQNAYQTVRTSGLQLVVTPTSATVPAQAPAAGATQRDEASGLEFVWQPTSQGPAHLRGFWMGKADVTVEAYQRCVKAKGCESAALTKDDDLHHCNAKNGRAGLPMNCANAAEAAVFCAWVGGRLVTAPEWDYVIANRWGSLDRTEGAPRWEASDDWGDPEPGVPDPAVTFRCVR